MSGIGDRDAPKAGANLTYNVTMPADWWEAVGRLATAKETTRAELIRELIAKALSKEERAKLSQPAKRGRPW